MNVQKTLTIAILMQSAPTPLVTFSVSVKMVLLEMELAVHVSRNLLQEKINAWASFNERYF